MSTFFNYAPLDSTTDEFRLITLLPGEQDSQIYLEIQHERLTDPGPPLPLNRLDINALRKTLSNGWDVEETQDGRYAFIRSGVGSTWAHPDASIDPDLYAAPCYQNHFPSYEALSYTWGPPEPSEMIRVVGEKGAVCAKMSIGPNLAEALRYLRHKDASRVLWIDALCIDQSNLTERSEQVKRMGNIYAWANRVIIWVGKDLDQSPDAIQALQFLSQQIIYSRDAWIILNPDRQYDLLEYDLLPPWDDWLWTAISRFLDRAWFDRVWVLQEAQLANTQAFIQCGPDTMYWHVFRNALLVLQGKSGLSPELNYRTQKLSEAFVGPKLMNITAASRYRRCTDPKDRIYGILNLLDDCTRERFRPDYASSVAKFYKDATKIFIETSRDLDLLGTCNIRKSYPGTPSWVPNYDGRMESLHSYKGQGSILSKDRAFASSDSHGNMRIMGRCIADIQSIS